MPTVLKILLLVGLVILLIVIAGKCPDDPQVTAIEIVPHQVTIGANPAGPTTFELEARLWVGPPEDRLSIDESQGYKLPSWKVTEPWLKVKSHSGFKAVIEVQKGALPSAPGFVKATSGIKTTQPGAEISVVGDPVPGQDLFKTIYKPDKSPDAVVSNGVPGTTGTPCRVALSALVTSSTVGRLVAPCPEPDGLWGTALLSVDHGLLFMPGGWTNSDDMVDAGPSEGPPRVLPLALHVMIGNSSLGASALASLKDDVLQTAQKEIGAASSILAESRAGIELKIARTTTDAVPDRVEVADCLDAETQASLDSPGILNVYYVNSAGGFRGFSCTWYEGRRQGVIYNSWEGHSPSTFVHELGHVLGLSLPSAGHPDNVGGFDRTNVMTSGLDDRDPGGRRRLTVGQVFRMNADSASWLNWSVDHLDAVTPLDALDALAIPVRQRTAPRLTCQCGTANPTGRCPPLNDDVALASGRVDAEHSWNCFDRLWLGKVPASTAEEPVAIVAGRPWGAPPRSCRLDLPGTADKHWGATFITFPNLTRAGNCISSVAIFFQHHGLIYLQLPEPAVVWTNSAEEHPVQDEMLDPIRVQVKVYHPTGAAGIANDVNHALQTFGAFNWSGIALDFDLNPPGTCQQPSLPLEITLCYSSGGAEEGKVTGNRAIEINLLKRTPTTVSHLLGQSLGLDNVSVSDPVFDDNIMKADPAKRGQKLTLGQVFRVNAALLPSLYSCGPGCPPITADVPR
jgi:hypothetical protein